MGKFCRNYSYYSWLFCFRQKEQRNYFFPCSWIVGINTCCDSPLSSIIVSLKIPVISTSSLSRVIVLFSFSVAALAAFGIDNFLEILKKKDIRKIYKLFIIPLLLIAFFSILPILINVPQDRLSIAVKSLRIPLVLIAILAGAIIVEIRVKKTNLLAFIILLLVGLQSVLFASKWMPFDPKALAFPSLPLIDAIQKNIAYGS